MYIVMQKDSDNFTKVASVAFPTEADAKRQIPLLISKYILESGHIGRLFKMDNSIIDAKTNTVVQIYWTTSLFEPVNEPPKQTHFTSKERLTKCQLQMS